MPEIGTNIGPYELLDLLGQGGMGQVWRARHLSTGQLAALKTLRVPTEGRLRSLRREVHALARLRHPGIVRILDEGLGERVPWYAMELLDGRTLREMLADGPLAPRKGIEYGAQIAAGLAAAHARGVVHRDLKPENVFITRDGRAKILDFGLAKPAAPIAADGTIAATYTPTSPGTVLGTVGYMSPEQVRGESVDHRSDIFSLGAMLYEVFSGTRAFTAAIIRLL